METADCFFLIIDILRLLVGFFQKKNFFGEFLLVNEMQEKRMKPTTWLRVTVRIIIFDPNNLSSV